MSKGPPLVLAVVLAAAASAAPSDVCAQPATGARRAGVRLVTR